MLRGGVRSASPSRPGLHECGKLPHCEGEIPTPQNSPGICMEVTASVGGENVLVAGAGNRRRRGRNILRQSEGERKVRRRPQLLLNVLAGTNNLVPQELLIGRAAIGVIACVATDLIAPALQNLGLLPGVGRKSVFV